MKNVQLYIDIAFCLVFMPLMIFVFPVEKWWGSYPVFLGLFVAWMYITYFLYKYFIMPRLFIDRRSRIYAIAAILLSLSITFLFSRHRVRPPYHELHRQLIEAYPYPVWGARQDVQAVWLHYITVVIFCIAVGMLKEAYSQSLARKEMEYERNKAELALYKAQINPHFLFNTLNTIYGLLITHSDRTEITLERFINLTKYMYNNANKDFITLEEEVEYIDEYIALQTLRMNEFAEISFSHNIESKDTAVPPMLLITFIENAFKYGISSNEPCFIHISLRQHLDTVSLDVENSKFECEKKASRQMGIENCRKRLSLLYPGRHRLEIQDGKKDNIFRIHLEFKPTQLS